MGLDMYLKKYPRVGYRPEIINAIDHLEDWRKYKKDHPNCTFQQYRGGTIGFNDLPKGKKLKDILSLQQVWYREWDEEKKYPHMSIYEEVAYWRKANAIHKWFVENVQDGEDDCLYHREIMRDDLEKLMKACKKILDKTKLVNGKVINGSSLVNGEWVPNIEDGLIVDKPEICDEVLPSESGFFFGSTDYDQYYYEDIEYTYDVCKKLLKETDFAKECLYYVSSW